MLVGVVLAGFFGVMRCVVVMTGCHVRVMRGLLMVPGGVMFGGCAMMARRMFVVLCGFQMMLSGFFRHGLPFCG